MTAVTAERTELEQFNTVVDRWQERVTRALHDVPVADGDVFERWAETVRQLSEAIDHAVPPSLDPEDVAEIRGDLLAIVQSVLAHDPKRPLDSYEQTLLRLEAIRHVIRDALDQHLPGEHDARVLLASLEEALPRIGRRELAQLLGTSERSVQRILASRAPVEPARRLLLVARLVELLRRGWTPEGVVAWLQRPRPALDGATPLDAIEDPAREHDVLALARAGRAQHGS
jgi:hypothetical protein